MKRRDFLKILSAVPAVAAVPALAKADESTETMDAVGISNDALSFIGEMNKTIAQTGEIMNDNASNAWPLEWGNKRITPTGTYEAGDIVIGADGKKYRCVTKA